MIAAPTVADYRRMEASRDRWHAALTGLGLVILAVGVFWLLPWPPRVQQKSEEPTGSPSLNAGAPPRAAPAVFQGTGGVCADSGIAVAQPGALQVRPAGHPQPCRTLAFDLAQTYSGQGRR